MTRTSTPRASERCSSSATQLWTVAAAGRPDATDEDQLILAMRKDAVLVTHDRELATSREKMPIGQLIRLKCPEWEAAALLTDLIPDVAALLQRRPDVILYMSRTSIGAATFRAVFGTELT